MLKMPGLPAMNPMVKAILKVEGQTVPIPVRFNPESYSVTSKPEISKKNVKGANGEYVQFLSGGGSVLSMVLHFDTYNLPMRAVDVRLMTVPFTKLVKMEGEAHQPPLVTFVYGSFLFKGIITKADQKFTMFSRLGIPVRCELTLEITKTLSAEDIEEEPKESSDRTKVRELIEGDQLWMLSDREYDSPEYWRKIAEANNIDNPRLLNHRYKLEVPVLE